MTAVQDLADDELVLMVKEGNSPGTPGSEAFWELWRRHETRVRRQAAWLSWLGRGDSVQDFIDCVVDRVRDNLLARLATYNGDGALDSFVRRVVYNAAIDERRHRAARKGQELRPGVSDGGPTTVDELLATIAEWEPPPVFPPPGKSVEERDKLTTLRQALERLAREPGLEGTSGLDLALVLRAHYLDGKTFDQIAAEFGVSSRTVYRWMKVGLGELRRLLDEMFGIKGRRHI